MNLYIIFILILEIVFIVLANKYKDRKYFKISNGLFFGLFISLISYYFYYTSSLFSFDTGEWVSLSELILSIFFSIINIIIGIVGLILKMLMKKKNVLSDTSKKWLTFKYFLIISVLGVIIVFCQYAIRNYEKNKIDNEVVKKTIDYLEDKYESDDFRVIDIYRHFSSNGFIGTDSLVSYDVTINYKDLRFRVILGVDDNRNIVEEYSSDNLAFKYYESIINPNDYYYAKNELNRYLKSNNFNVDIKVSDYISDEELDILLKDYITTLSDDEIYDIILDYFINHEFIINIMNIDSDLELEEYLKSIASYIIEYYGDLDDYVIKFNYNRNYGFIKIDKEFIYLNIDGEEERIKR